VLIEGALAGRRLVEPISGKPWPGSELLANTIVQLLVDANGRPVSATLLASSGVPEADRFALEGAQKLRFAPLPNKSEGPPSAPGNMSLGRIVFQWQTVPEPSNGDSQKTK
jgi:TonB family protein